MICTVLPLAFPFKYSLRKQVENFDFENGNSIFNL